VQLVSEHTIMWDTMRDACSGVPKSKSALGCAWINCEICWALTGDTSDNIPGVPSLARKQPRNCWSNSELCRASTSASDELKKKGLRDKLIEHREQAFLSQRLVTLTGRCPILLELETLRYGGRDSQCAARAVRRARLPTTATSAPERRRRPCPQRGSTGNPRALHPLPRPRGAAPGQPQRWSARRRFSVLTSKKSWPSWRYAARRRRLRDCGRRPALPNTLRSALVGVSLAWQPGKAVYLPIGHR